MVVCPDARRPILVAIALGESETRVFSSPAEEPLNNEFANQAKRLPLENRVRYSGLIRIRMGDRP